EAQAIKLNVFRIFEEVVGVTDQDGTEQRCSAPASRCPGGGIRAQASSLVADVWRPTVVIHEIGAIFGDVTSPAQRQTKLAGVARVAVTTTGQNDTFRVNSDPVKQRGTRRPQS